MKPPSDLYKPWPRRAAAQWLAAASALVAAGAIAAPNAAPTAMAHPAPPPLPAVNLTVWLRHVDVQHPGSVTISTQNQQRPLLATQQLRVRNGGRAMFRMDQAIPLQWVTAASGFQSQSQGRQSASTQIGSPPPPAGSASMNRSSEWRERSDGGAFQQQIIWLQTGQSLAVQPTWAGGNAPVDITIDLQQANTGPGTSTMTPRQNSVQVATSVFGHIGEWVTIAATGHAQTPGNYSSEAARNPPRALQVRITLD